MWRRLRSSKSWWTCVICMRGLGFNLLVNPDDKSNNAINRRMIVHFRSKLNAMELKEIYLNGHRYTWSNEREHATLEKIENVFTTTSWEDLYPDCFLSALGTAVCDHCPLLLDLHAEFNVADGLGLNPPGLRRMDLWIQWRRCGFQSHLWGTHLSCWMRSYAQRQRAAEME